MAWEKWLNKKRFTLFRTAILQEQFIQCIIDHTPSGGVVLETGFGFGTTLELLRDLGFKTCGFDLEETAIKNAAIRFPLLGENLYIGNMLHHAAYHKKVDTIIHQGVLEHFNDEDILSILKLQSSMASRIVFDVPNNLRKHLDDEGEMTRFESPEFWEEMLSKLDLNYQRFGRTYDYGNEFLPEVLKKYNSDLMKTCGRSSIFVVEGR